MSKVTFDEFDNCEVKEASIKFKSADAAITFGCMGRININSNTTTKTKKCEGRVAKEVTKVDSLNVEVGSHLTRTVDRKLVGMSNEGLKKGVYAYGNRSFCEAFIFTAVIEDMDENRKLIAIPNCTNAQGLSITVDNDATEIAVKDLNFKAMEDDYGQFLYTAEEADLEDATVKDLWLTNFSHDLVKLTEETTEETNGEG